LDEGEPGVFRRAAGVVHRGLRQRVTVTAADGRTVSIPTYDAGESFDHRAFFALPWVSGTSVIRAYDDAGNELACGTTGKGSRCPG
jgi:hypothetical protein